MYFRGSVSSAYEKHKDSGETFHEHNGYSAPGRASRALSFIISVFSVCSVVSNWLLPTQSEREPTKVMNITTIFPNLGAHRRPTPCYLTGEGEGAILNSPDA